MRSWGVEIFALPTWLGGEGARRRSDPGGLTSLAEALQLLAASALAGLLIISLAPHLFPQSAPLAQLTEAADGFLNRLSGTNP
jgi:hypothetical protein